MNEENKNIRSPREIFELAQTMFLNKDLSSFSDLFASDGILELPFHIQKSMRLIQGRENIRNYLAMMPVALLKPIGYESMTIHETSNSEIIIAEYDMYGEVMANSKPFQRRYLQVVEVRNGEIITLRDYWNPIDTFEILDRLPELCTILTQK
ncbi:nuclear transport factor 2 family protein [uncultured Clostridium sp.]|uniref:nuclear transport factor 2 family protein n=1 Tax=uncultured Clostridium sp. TaxID=59620 RepID=UPI0028EE66AE|nr:nuclear transport factor 2 family protein [uncultured Clostridium sp.]